MAELTFREYVSYKKLTNCYGPVRYMNKDGITYDAVKTAIENASEDYGIDLVLAMGDVNYGTFSGTKEALMLVHPKHIDDYYKFCCIITPLGKTCTVEIFYYGESFQEKMMNGKGLKKLLRDGNAYEEEKAWYDIVKEILASVIC